MSLVQSPCSFRTVMNISKLEGLALTQAVTEAKSCRALSRGILLE